MLTYPDINPVALRIPLPWGELPIHWYGIMYVIGFAAAWWLARRQAARPGSTWNAEQVDDMIFWVMVGVILGGRLGYVLLYVLPYQLELLRADWLYPIKIWQGGMSFHGALAGVIIALLWYARSQKRRALDVLDFCATLPGIGICAGRIGNFINGELWGAPTDWKWGFLVQDPVSGQLVGRHASQLYEAGLEGIALYLLLLWYSRRPRPRGAVVGLGLIWYALVRMSIELVRVPDLQIGYLTGSWLTMGQLLSLPMLIAGVVLLMRAWRHPQPSGNLVPAA
ncbi:MAG: prolipoprotein diacylglyceryl transferase [Pseudomonadota bacterium]